MSGASEHIKGLPPRRRVTTADLFRPWFFRAVTGVDPVPHTLTVPDARLITATGSNELIIHVGGTPDTSGNIAGVTNWSAQLWLLGGDAPKGITERWGKVICGGSFLDMDNLTLCQRFDIAGWHLAMFQITALVLAGGELEVLARSL